MLASPVPARADSVVNPLPQRGDPVSAAARLQKLPQPAGWKPDVITAVPARRRPGMLVATTDALRGIQELGNGQPLSGAQVRTLTPFLAGAYRLPTAQVSSDLDAVRFYIGGAAADKPRYAVQMDHAIYVNAESDLQKMLDWSGRRWLTHELGHVMQWRTAGSWSDLDRTRRSVARYAQGMVADGARPGAIPVGTWNWVRSRLKSGAEKVSLADAIHDAHPMEREAERHAQALLSQTS